LVSEKIRREKVGSEAIHLFICSLRANKFAQWKTGLKIYFEKHNLEKCVNKFNSLVDKIFYIKKRRPTLRILQQLLHSFKLFYCLTLVFQSEPSRQLLNL
jgi:hypothetical protein